MSTAAETPATVHARAWIADDRLVLLAIAAMLIGAAAMRREFLGDGVRHLPAILSGHLLLGEPRWLLFPALATLWTRLLAAAGLVGGAESVLRGLLALSVASGLLFLFSIRAWLRAECSHGGRRAVALLLAGSCAPSLILFSDVAEPQVAAAMATAGLAYARIWRNDATRAPGATICAIAAVAIASLIYQGMILALGLLPLVVSIETVGLRRLTIAAGTAILVVMVTMAGARTATGVPLIAAAAAVVRGEQNPLTRSLMASPSAVKYVAAAVAGPPQGIVALEHYGGLRTLFASLASGDRPVVAASVTTLILLLVGLVVSATLLVRGVRDRQWRVLIAAAVLLALPVVRNQQYGYVKFYILWPIPVALLAIRFRARTIFTIAIIVLGANGWLVGKQIRRGRETYNLTRAAYAGVTPSACWMTSGWTPPFAYLWPGTVAPILGTLATGSNPEVQRAALTASLQRCFCDSNRVWTDTTTRDAQLVRFIADHFDYRAVDVTSVLIDQSASNGHPLAGVAVYSDAARQQACRVFR